MGKFFRGAIATVLGCFVCLNPIFAAEAFKDFTFRTVKPPVAGAKKLINIQIAPESQDTLAEEVVEIVKQTDSNEWFWSEISPDLSAAGPGRFQTALQVLAKSPEGRAVVTPRIGTCQQIVSDYGSQILLSTIGTRISPALLLSMIGVESTGNADAQSKAGALGLMQLMPATAEQFGVNDPTDATQSIQGGVAYMEWLLDQFDNDPILALAAYNAGVGSVHSHKGVPPFAETRAYVPKIVAGFQVARALCLTPPELYSDGCVFDLKGGE
jgi:hypothetical protein